MYNKMVLRFRIVGKQSSTICSRPNMIIKLLGYLNSSYVGYYLGEYMIIRYLDNEEQRSLTSGPSNQFMGSKVPPPQSTQRFSRIRPLPLFSKHKYTCQ